MTNTPASSSAIAEVIWYTEVTKQAILSVT